MLKSQVVSVGDLEEIQIMIEKQQVGHLICSFKRYFLIGIFI